MTRSERKAPTSREINIEVESYLKEVEEQEYEDFMIALYYELLSDK